MPPAQTQLLNFQRARLFAVRSEREFVIISAAVVADVVVRIEGNYEMSLGPDIPVYWLPETDRLLGVGSEEWDVFIKRVGFGVASISFAKWSTDTVLAELRNVFPTIQTALPDPS